MNKKNFIKINVFLNYYLHLIILIFLIKYYYQLIIYHLNYQFIFPFLKKLFIL